MNYVFFSDYEDDLWIVKDEEETRIRRELRCKEEETMVIMMMITRER